MVPGARSGSVGAMLAIRPTLTLAAAVLALAAAPAAASDTYVSPAGDDNAPCTQAEPCATVTHGIAVAAAGDAVHIAVGLYEEAIELTKDVALVGGGSGTLESFDSAEETIIRPATNVTAITAWLAASACHEMLSLLALRRGE